MTRLLAVFLIAMLATPLVGGPVPAMAQTDAAEQLGGADADVNCPNLQSVEDAATLYDATIATDDEDVYDLDGTPEDDVACNADQTSIGTEALASCADLRLAEHAEALFVAGGADDPYGLDPNGNGIPCDGGAIVDPEPVPSDLPPVAVADPEPVDTVEAPTDCDVIVENGRAFVFTDCADGTVRAGFQPFEGFDAFAAGAQNGFGAFDDVAGETDSATTVEVQQSLPATEPATSSTTQQPATGEPRVVEGAQKVRNPKATARAKQKAKALKAKKLKRAKERKAKQAQLKRLRESRRLAD